MSRRRENSETVKKTQRNKDNIRKLEVIQKNRQNRKPRHDPSRRRNNHGSRNSRGSYVFYRISVDKKDLQKNAEKVFVISNIANIFESAVERAELMQEIAAMDGYKCEFSEQERLVLVTKSKKFEDSLLQHNPDFSKNPPKKWQEKEDKNESLFDFIAREYRIWIGKNLLQGHIRKYDMPLYYALANMKSKNKIDVLKELGVPSKKELTKELVDDKEIIEDPEIKAAIRLRERIRMRQRRSQQPKLGR